MSKSKGKSDKSGESGSRYRLCVPPCKHYITSGDTHSMCAACLGAEHAASALEGADCPHCELLPLRTLRSGKALFEDGAFTSVPQGAGPASAEAERLLHSWGSQLDLLEGMETGDPLSPSSPNRSVARYAGSEALPEATSSHGTGSSLHLSSSEEVDLDSTTEEPLPQSLQYEELLEVVTRAVSKLNIDWPAMEKAAPQKSKLDERFLGRAFLFFPDLHAEISRSWARPFSACLFVPASDYYGNMAGLDERAYKTMPQVEQTYGQLSVSRSYLTLQAASHHISAGGMFAYHVCAPDLDEGEKVDLAELHRTTDLACRATKETARAVGRSMAAMVAAERHLWQTLSAMKEKDCVFLLDAPLKPSGLFGDAVDSVISRYQEARKQAAAFQRFLPSHSLAPAAAGHEQMQLCNSSSALVGPEQALVMEQEVETLLRKEAIEEVPPHDMESGFYSRYFIVSKKDGGLRPIIDLRRLNCSVMRLKFKMLTVKQVVSQIRSEDWFVTIDLKDTYFHVSILPQHRKFLRFAFRGEAYQYWVLPFGLALSPRTFTKCVDAALVPLHLQGIRILNYINDWLILAEFHSHTHGNVGVKTKRQEKTTYLGVVWDLTMMQAHLSPARIEVKEGRSLTVKQQLVGLMVAVSNVIPFGLLYMRPL
ncbi:hypothetical protein M9458_003334, partial [Cirrhinus mrigala]